MVGVLGAQGQVVLQLDPDVSVPWTWWRYRGDAAPVFDVELERADPLLVVRLVEGRAVLSPEATSDV